VPSPERPDRYEVLVYAYVPDVVERRAPHRARHLELLREHGVVMGGALGDPPTGGLIAFPPGGAAEAFARADPYVAAGLVTAWRVEPWTVVA